jgi:peptidoglycan/LPS O-acetylase OafA/YrhL
MHWTRLYQNRLFRIAPMYLFTVLAMLLIVFVATDFTLNEPAAAVFAAVLQWLALGIVNLQPDVNGYPATRVIASVTWTISYEWAFYGSLLLTAYFARGRAHLLLVSIAWALCLMVRTAFKIDTLGFVALFLSGMMVASAIHAGWVARWPDRVTSALAVACLALIFLVAPLVGHPLGGYGTGATVLLTICFYFICSGASLFGLLATRAARRLGNVSYSMYLLQGVVLTIVFANPAVRSYALAAPENYWLAGLLCSVVLITVSCLTYAFIELPCMQFGKLRRTPGLPQGFDTHALASVAGNAPDASLDVPQLRQGIKPAERLPGRAPAAGILPQ